MWPQGSKRRAVVRRHRNAVPRDCCGHPLHSGMPSIQQGLPVPYSRKKYNKDPKPELSNGHLIALDSDAAQNAAWARRAEMISYLPRSARVEGGGEAASRVRRVKLRPRTVIPSCCHMIEYAYIVWTYSIHMIAYLRARAPERRSER